MAGPRGSEPSRQAARQIRVNEQRRIIAAIAKLLVRGGSSGVGRQGIEPLGDLKESMCRSDVLLGEASGDETQGVGSQMHEHRCHQVARALAEGVEDATGESCDPEC
jgi:hypothetical protein